ncbi:toprim domain-containing protein [Robertmurraya sp. DFI.2.37]|uniref:toprim domain-containing protein n=1 Tax=Robertmurraya sp. DFI.2.37 TaxID=3031819 RepID=UPI00124702F4|nr:toprim domain-containing protein [Robertmurraya sp. DFI.2.37]MDF1510695.1 toprim domain-containing protein [Robertmurraya sp. DFI.2.37]
MSNTIKIRGQTVDVDVRAELEAFEWTRPRWSTDKLIAASPFRYDQTPSFFVRLEPYGDYPPGTWSDSGAYDAEWQSGNFVKLLAFLRNETYEETEDYLLCAYGNDYTADDIKLKPIRLRIQRGRQSLNNVILAPYAENYDYLLKRGISPDVQRQMGVLHDAGNKAVVIPWRLADGRLANVKYRKTYGKAFWYANSPDARPIRELIYGIDHAASQTVICEAEIDAMSWREVGYAAVAVGGSSFNEYKRDVLLRSPIEDLIIATDNDKAGGKLRAEIERYMRGYMRLNNAYVDSRVKDANEALVRFGVQALRDAVKKSEGRKSLNLKIR